MNDLLASLIALGGLGGIGALITGIATFIKASRVKDDTAELRPDHGSSMADQVGRIEKHLAGLSATVSGLDARLDDMAHSVRSVGHQIGEIRQDASTQHADHDRRLSALSERIGQVEKRRR